MRSPGTDTSTPESASRARELLRTVSGKSAWTTTAKTVADATPLAGLGATKVFVLGVQRAKEVAAV